MNLQQFLLAFTFVYGIVALLTYTKIFEKAIGGFFDSLTVNKLKPFYQWLDMVIFISSLIYQSWYWLFKN